MPKTLISIVNARPREAWRNALRNSWLPQVPKDKADAFFFVGRGDPVRDTDRVVELDCSDGYEHLPDKIRSITRWADAHGYEHMLKLDDDVIVRPNDLLSSGYDLHPYSGRSNRPESSYAIPMGFAYWMDQQSMRIISNTDLPGDGSNDDEKWCAYTLSNNGIFLHDDKRYFLHQQRILDSKPVQRPLRAPKRPVVDTSSWGPEQFIGTFAWCVHIAGEIETKIEEYNKLFEKHGEK